MEKKSRQKLGNISSINIMQKIHQKLETYFSYTKEQTTVFDDVWKGILSNDEDAEYSEYATQVSEGRIAYTPTTPNMEDGTTQEVIFRDSYSTLMCQYLIKKYGYQSGVLYWFALVSKPQEFYEMLDSLKEDFEERDRLDRLHELSNFLHTPQTGHAHLGVKSRNNKRNSQSTYRTLTNRYDQSS